MQPHDGSPAAAPQPSVAASPEPALSPVWTRQRPAWKLGLRAATASLGTLAPTLYLLYVRSGAISWRTALAIDVALAVGSGAIAMARPWAGRVRLGTRFGAMLESEAIIPWFVGASLCALAGLAAGISLFRGDALVGMTAAVGATVAWSWAFTRWWDRRQPVRDEPAPPSPSHTRR